MIDARLLAQALDRGVDRHDVVAHAKRLRGLGGIAQALIAGEGVGQHDAMHALGAERIDGHGDAERRVDAAGKSEHHAGEAVLVHIVAQAEDAGEVVGGIALLNLGERLGLASPAIAVAAPFGDRQGLFPSRHLHGEAAVGIEHERRAVEHKLVLAANLVDVGQGQSGLGHARPRNRIALALLVHPIGRAVRHDEEPSPCLGQRLAGLFAPDVFAHWHA